MDEEKIGDSNLGEQMRRRKRINRMKTGMLVLLSLWVVVSVFFMVFFGFRLNRLTQQIKTLQENQEILEEYLQSENDVINQLSESLMEYQEEPDTEDAGESGDTDGTAREEEVQTSQESAQPEVEDDVHRVYLTFDDGPSEYTEEILDILDQYQVKATFFVIGKEDEHSVEMYKEIVNRGHTLAMHSFSHKYNEIYASLDAFQEDFHKLQSYLEGITGVKPVFYRFPGGSSNQVSNTDMGVFINFLNEEGITYFDWNVSSGDATQSYSSQSVIDNVMSDVDKFHTSVVLMHDTSQKHATIEALPALIEQLQAEDDVILPIDETTVLVQHISADSVTQ